MRSTVKSRQPVAVFVPSAVLVVVSATAQVTHAERPELLLSANDGSPLTSVVYSPDGSLIATGSWGGTIVLHRADTGEVVGRTRLTSRGYPLLFTPDGGRLITVYGAIMQWDATTLEAEASPALPAFTESECARTSADGRRLLIGGGVADGRQYSKDDSDFEVRLVDLDTGGTVCQMLGHTDCVWAVAFADAESTVVSASLDGTVRRWDAATGEPLDSFRWGEAGPLRASQYLPHLALTSDGRLLAATGADGMVEIWDVASQSRVQKLHAGVPPVWTVAFSRDDALLAANCSDGTTCVWEVASGSLVKRIGAVPGSLGFNPDGRRLAVGAWWGNGLQVFDVSPSALLLNEARSTSRAHALQYSPDGRRLAAGYFSGAVVIWDAQSGSPVLRLPRDRAAVVGLCFSPDGRRLVTGSDWVEGGNVWDACTGELLTHFAPGAGMWRSSFSPDGELIASGLSDGRVALWHSRTGDILHEWPGHHPVSVPVSFSPDGKLLASSTADFHVIVYDTASGETVADLAGHSNLPRALAFTNDGKTLVSAGHDRSFRIWDAKTWQCRHVAHSTYGAFDVIFDEHNRRAFLLNGQGQVVEFDLATGEAVGRPRGGGEPRSHSIALSPDRSRVATDSPDGIGIWDVDSGRLLGRLTMVFDEDGSPQGHLIATPEGYYTGSAEAARVVTWRVGNEVYPAEAYRDVFYRPDFVAASLRGEPLEGVRILDQEDVPPGVQALSPRDFERVAPGSVPVNLITYGYREVQELEIYTNGRRVPSQIERGILIAARGIIMAARDLPRQYRVSRSFSGTVPLPPGEPRVTLRFVAVDEAGLRSRPAEVSVIQTGVEPVRGALHSVCVGVSRYGDEALRLGSAADDARALAQALAGQAGPDRLYERVASKVLTDAEASVPAVRAALEGVVRDAAPADTVLLFLSGHGLRDEHFKYYFATCETDLEDLAGSALAWIEFQDMVRRLRARQVLVLLDTCHAAAALGDYLVTSQALGEVLADRAGVMVLASSSPAEKSYESPDWGHGAFTKALLEALDGACGQRLSPGVLEDYVGSRVAALTSNRQHPYVPIRTQFPAGTPLLLGAAKSAD